MLADDETTETLDDAIAWCLAQRDSGTHVNEQVAIETFPQYADEIRSFLRKERKFERALAQPLNERAPTPPRNIGKYELRRTIGTGAFGHVFLAWDTEMLRHVALKTARFVCNDGVTRERFLHEARASAQLRHQNIVRVFDFGEIEGTAFLVLEFIEGNPLSKWADGDMEPFKATRMVAAVVDAVVHAHGRGIVHRDLTPKNIIIDADGKPNVLDFGLAKLVLSQSTLRMSGEVIGTPSYVSPEQVTGKAHEVDGRSDIYSVGVILYELLTGDRPLDGSLDLLLHRIQFEVPAYLCDVDPSIPTELADICQKCLKKKPEERYATARELRADLQAFLGKGSTPLVKERTTRRSMVGLAAIGLLLVGGLFLLSKFTQPPRADRTPEVNSTRVAQDYTDLSLGLVLLSRSPSFDGQAADWEATGDYAPASERVVNRDWTPDPLLRFPSKLGSTYLSLPANENLVGYNQKIVIDPQSKYHVVECYGSKDGGWANFGVTYYEIVGEHWKELKIYRQRFRPSSQPRRGKGDGMTLHRFGFEIPDQTGAAALWFWHERTDGTALNIDEIALYDYVPVGDENLVLDGKFDIGTFEIRDPTDSSSKIRTEDPVRPRAW